MFSAWLHSQKWIGSALMLMMLAAIGASLGCESSSTASKSKADGSGPQKVTLMLNWYPEAEHGGFYAAEVHGIFKKHGLDVEIRAGGENSPVAQELVTGRVQFAIANADDVLLYREQGADIVSLLAPIQQTPRCVLVRAESGIDSLSKLKGLTLQANKGQAFLSYMEVRGMLEGVQVIPYAGSVAQFVADKNTAIQAYNFSEPQLAEEKGVPVKTLMLSEIGFNPYASCLVTTGDTITRNSDLVKRMTAACREGWQKYLEAPAETNAMILSLNRERMTAAALDYGADKLKPLCLTGDAGSVGKMNVERWQQLVDQFVELKLITASKVIAGETFVEFPSE